MNNEEFDKMMEEMIVKIMEHGDACRIFVNCHDGGEEKTKSYTIGKGNFHAQRDQVREWLDMQDQYIKEKAKQDVHEDDDL